MEAGNLKRVLCVGLFWLAACGPVVSATVRPRTPTDPWTIRLGQSGGFAGVNLIIDVASTGQMTVLDARSGRRYSGMLSDAEIAEIDRLIASADVLPTAIVDSQCADCFVYDVAIQTSRAGISLRVDDTTIRDSGLEPLVTYLRGLRDYALAHAQ